MKSTTILFCFFIFIYINFTFSQQVTKKDTTIYTLNEIVITGERKATPTIEVPLAISLVKAFDLSHVRGYGLDEVLGLVPGTLAQSRYGNQDIRLTIRGFGARGAGERSNAGTSRGIRILTDGIPETEPDGRTSFDLIDLTNAGRIEIVRSNASAVWGNAAGGVVNISSNTFFDRPYVDVQSSFGSFGFHKEHVSIGSILDNGKLFVSYSNTNFDGWRDHSNSSQLLLNAGVLSQLGNRTSLGVFLSGTSNFFRIPGPLTQSQFDSNPQQAQADTMNYSASYVQRDERRYNRLGRIGTTLTHELDDANSISAMVFVSPKYLQRSERNTFRDFNRYHTGGNFIYTNLASFASTIKSEFQIGMDEAYQDGAILFYSLVNGNRGTTIKDDKREGANNLGVFAQEEFNLNDKFTLLIGGRYDNITYYYENFITPNINDQKSFEHITPKAGIAFRFSPMHSIYANLGGGIEVPAGNETDPPSTFGQDTITALNPLLNPIKSTTFEIGTKHILMMDGSSFLNTLQYDVALYLIQVTDDIIPYRGGRFYFTAGKTKRLGAEIGADAQFDYGLSVQAAFSFSKNTYDEYIIDSVHYKKPGAFDDLSGNKMAGLPDMFYHVRIRYKPSFVEGLYADVSMHGVGKYFADDINMLNVEAYNVINASIGIDNVNMMNDQLVCRAFVGINNITDKKYAASAFINPDYDRTGKQAIYLEPGLPRNFVGSFSLGWKF